MSSSTEPITVAELNGFIKSILEETFEQLWVVAEISDISRPRSGHVYFTLKDANSQIRAVMWRTTAMRIESELGGSLPAEGDRVLCLGGVDVYPPRGSYQFNVRRMQPQGIGALQQKFLRLQKLLADEGLFAAERKQPIPAMPARIAVITSPTSAAVRDFLQAAAARFSGVEIVIIPTLVQGSGATTSIIAGLAAAERHVPAIDTIVITRGGGSLEDLWSFNEESVVRAIFATRIPVVSGIGHEIDVTLTDLVADSRALTPTDAAAKALPDRKLLVATTTELRHRLHTMMRNRLANAQLTLDSLAARAVITRPHDIVRNRYREIDDLESAARRAIRQRLQTARAEMQRYAASADALSPLKTLARGYSVTLTASGNAITKTAQVQPGDTIHTRVTNGEIKSTVQQHRQQ